MGHSQFNPHSCAALLICGTVLTSVALFLHPMSPEDFLGLALSDPLQTVNDAQGGNMATFFWISVAMAASGLSGLLMSSHLFRRLLHPPKHHLRTLRH